MVKIVKFGAPWCGPCKLQDKILEELVREKGYDVEFVNVDEAEERAEECGVTNVPTLLFYDEDKLVERKIGLTQKNDIISICERFT